MTKNIFILFLTSILFITESFQNDEDFRKIHNGQVTQRNEFGFVVAILKLGIGTYVCTGSLLYDRWVLTVRLF